MKRYALTCWLALVLAASITIVDPFTNPKAQAAGDPMTAQPAIDYNRHVFSFLYGEWVIRNHRMLHPLSGDGQWEEFEARSRCWPILDGAGNSDEFRSDHRPGRVGMSLRLFDAQAGRWSIYWMDERTGSLAPPVVGAFVGDTGVFDGPDEWNGRPIKVRYIWSDVHSGHPRWEQAFSVDGGSTWETNWKMEFTHRGA
jgi:hypothetical protein